MLGGSASAQAAPYSEEVLADSPWGYWRFEEGYNRANLNCNGPDHPNGFPLLSEVGGFSRSGDYCPNVATRNSVTDVEPSDRTDGPAVELWNAKLRLGLFNFEPPPASRDFTWEIWFKSTDQTPDPFPLIAWTNTTRSDRAFHVRVDSGRLRIRSDWDFGAFQWRWCGPSGLDDGDWHHLAVVRDWSGRALRGYVDGEQACSEPTTSNVLGYGGPGYLPLIGPFTGGEPDFTFQIDEMAHYDHALSGERVAVHFRTPVDPAALARDHRPILLFDNSERWRPLLIDNFLAERFDPSGGRAPEGRGPPDSVTRHLLCEGHRTHPRCAPIHGVDDIAVVPPGPDGGARDDVWIDVHGSGGETYRMSGCTADGPADCLPERTGIYYRPVFFEQYLLLDYWWFFRRDGGYAGTGDHEGDWEGVTIAVERDGSSETFDWAAFDAHGHAWRYLRSVLRCDGGGDDSCGDQDDPHGRRVMTYVSSGKHASYPRDCDSDGPTICGQTGETLPEAGFDGGVDWERNDDEGALSPMPAEGTSWMAFPGIWGATIDREIGPLPIDLTSPHGPAWGQGRYESPAFPTDSGRTDFSGCPDILPTCGGILPFSIQTEMHPRCSDWYGPLVSVAACDPAALEDALARGEVSGEAGVTIQGSGLSDSTIGQGDGIAQVVGPILQRGDAVDVQGLQGGNAELLVRFADDGIPRLAFFDSAGPGAGERRLRLVRDRRGTIPVLHGPKQTIEPTAIEAVPPGAGVRTQP